MKAVKGNIETISCIRGLSAPKCKINLGTYVKTTIPIVFVKKTAIKIKIIDFIEIIKVYSPYLIYERIFFISEYNSINFLVTMFHLKLSSTLL